MLHKSKSKKINQFKFTLVIPLLALFLMSFNTKTIYIEKEINSYDLLKKNVIETPEIKETISKNSLLNSRVKKQQTITNDFVSATINKETREASLNKIVKTFEENGVTLKFRGIRRNNIGEIVAIKIEAISKKSNANFNISSDQTIKPISIMFDKKNDSVSIGNTTTKHKLNSFTFKSGDNDTVHKIHNLSKNYSAIFISDDGELHEIGRDSLRFTNSEGKVHKIILKKSNIVKVVSDDENEIEVVLENEEGHELEDKYIITRSTSEKDSLKRIKINQLPKETGNSKIIMTNTYTDKPLYIIDGKEAFEEDLKNIDPNQIKSLNVLKGDNAKKNYGEKGENGVIEIITKKKK